MFEDEVPGLNALANGKVKGWQARQLGMGHGCAYQGTMVCHGCPWAEEIAMVCDYDCYRCEAQERCPCGKKGQELLVEAALGPRLYDYEVGKNGRRNGQGS